MFKYRVLVLATAVAFGAFATGACGGKKKGGGGDGKGGGGGGWLSGSLQVKTFKHKLGGFSIKLPKGAKAEEKPVAVFIKHGKGFKRLLVNVWPSVTMPADIKNARRFMYLPGNKVSSKKTANGFVLINRKAGIEGVGVYVSRPEKTKYGKPAAIRCKATYVELMKKENFKPAVGKRLLEICKSVAAK